MENAGGEVIESKKVLKEVHTGVGKKTSLQKDDKMDVESNYEVGRKNKPKKKKKKDKNKTGRDHLDEIIVDYVESPMKERKKKKQKHNLDVESKSPKLMEEDGDNIDLAEDENVAAQALYAEDGRKDEKKRKKRKREKDVSDTEIMIAESDQKNVANENKLDGDVMEEVEHSRKKSKKKKKDDVYLEAASQEGMDGKLGNQNNLIGENEGNEYSIESEASGGKIKDHAIKKVKKKKKRKSAENGLKGKGSERKQRIGKGSEANNPSERSTPKGTSKRVSFSEDVEKDVSDTKIIIDGSNQKYIANGNIMEEVEHSRKKSKKKKKDNFCLETASQEGMDGKLGNKNNPIGENEGNEYAIESEASGGKIEDHAVKKVKKKKKKVKSAENGLERKGSERKQRVGKGFKANNPSERSTPKGTSKRVSFSEEVEVFPLSDCQSGETVQKKELVQGKRFSHEEDEMVKEAVLNYINARGLGEEGLKMVLNCKKHPEIKNCWKEIGEALPWRPYISVYYRAHILFERDERRSWTPEEYEIVHKFHEKYGAEWKTLAEALGKHRIHVKDAWRRIKLANRKRGRWSQEEYQTLFDLVNMDLRMKAFEEVRSSKHGMLRDNICWTAISDKLGSRTTPMCCMKWYNQLTSPMVAEGQWLDVDDYRLVIALYDLDACCMEDVDWDNLLEHRSGDVCRKRWNQMVKHLGDHGNKSFADQVEVLMQRYCPDVLEAREAYYSKPLVT
ncbi:RNA polymerase I termination factor isoform X2 [Manihot esculenta]|nr:RNA polymerase I termination factor isoform X2 [Manihot esculenta]OAY38061.1 hypothetical protein MANES_11G149200v8 [Manihot esculenta]